MIGEGTVRAIGDFVSRFGTRRAETVGNVPALPVSSADAPVFPTKALADFLKALRDKTTPVVVDLGRAVGANVTFLGEQLGCKIFVEDVLADLSPPSDEDGDEVSIQPLAHGDESVDGVLCWDVLEYLDPDAGRVLADEVKRVLRPGGVMLLCHGTEAPSRSGQTTYEILDEGSLRYRCDNGTRQKQRVLQSREMSTLFEPLTIADSFLLTSRMREMLFRKRPVATGAE